MRLPVLLADAGQLIVTLAVIFFLVLPTIGRVLATLVKAAGAPPMPPRPPQGGRVQAEIEEFLRRAARQRPGPTTAQGGQPAETPLPAEVLEEQPGEPIGAEVGRHVRKYMDTREFSRRSAQLGEEVTQSEEQFEQHLESAFSHEVSQLSKRPGESAQPSQPQAADAELAGATALPIVAAAGLADIFANSEYLRQAIIFNEIFQRPESRWE
ncbi:MAG: hypothetical protein ABSG68_17415 [Thermoguttaceae bacterium]|jgi:hypothetical protein